MTPWITTKDKIPCLQTKTSWYPYSNESCYVSPTLLIKGVSRVHDMNQCRVWCMCRCFYSKHPQTPPKHNMIWSKTNKKKQQTKQNKNLNKQENFKIAQNSRRTTSTHQNMQKFQPKTASNLNHHNNNVNNKPNYITYHNRTESKEAETDRKRNDDITIARTQSI